MQDLTADTIEAVDRFLAQCVRQAIAGNKDIPWDSALGRFEDAVVQRAAFHGIALILIDGSTTLIGWPPSILSSLREEARSQAFWEADHRNAIAGLIERLAEADIDALAMKGTALAYSVYSDPAARRRGDTDLLIETNSRDRVRAILRDAGFAPSGDRRALQEPWSTTHDTGFSHEVDIHWSINASMAVTRSLERDHPRQRCISLPRLSANARATCALDNFIHICINRASHESFGYMVDDEKVFGGDRLIWAVDLYLLSLSFSDADWHSLGQIAKSCGAALAVASGIAFAAATLQMHAPASLTEDLARSAPAAQSISAYFAAQSPRKRLGMDLAACRTMGERTGVLTNNALPGREFMQQRYPGSENWPLFALRARRLLDGGLRMLLGRKQ